MRKFKWTNKPLFVATMLLLAAATQAQTTADDETRISITSQGVAGPSGAIAERKTTRNEHKALTLTGNRGKPIRSKEQQESAAKSSSTASTANTPNTDFWFYTADVELFSDFDRDGFFSGIDLLFDVDTVYAVADVYAVVYLSYEYGPWNEYAETEDFTIFGTSANDEYVIETELVSGYPTGNYDILIELYDTFDNSLVAIIGPEDTSELSVLPLEDINRDSVAPGTTQVVVNSGGGGSLSWFLLLGLAGVVTLARKD